jgi:hypothetical protein
LGFFFAAHRKFPGACYVPFWEVRVNKFEWLLTGKLTFKMSSTTSAS